MMGSLDPAVQQSPFQAEQTNSGSQRLAWQKNVSLQNVGVLVQASCLAGVQIIESENPGLPQVGCQSLGHTEGSCTL